MSTAQLLRVSSHPGGGVCGVVGVCVTVVVGGSGSPQDPQQMSPENVYI